MDFDENINCNTCRYGYFLMFSSDGFHNLCGEGMCYLCATSNGYCDYYENGEPPEGSELI